MAQNYLPHGCGRGNTIEKVPAPCAVVVGELNRILRQLGDGCAGGFGGTALPRADGGRADAQLGCVTFHQNVEREAVVLGQGFEEGADEAAAAGIADGRGGLFLIRHAGFSKSLARVGGDVWYFTGGCRLLDGKRTAYVGAAQVCGRCYWSDCGLVPLNFELGQIGEFE